jgi:hypothetical protein
MKNVLLLALLTAFSASGQTFSVANQHHFGTAGDDYNPTVLKTPDGGFIIAASTTGNGLDHASASYGSADYWVVKLNASYAIEWEYAYGGTASDQFSDIQITPEGNYLIGGYSLSGVSGNKTAGSFGARDYWVVKINPQGGIIWDKSFGTTGTDQLSAMAVTDENTYLFAGYSTGGVSGTKTSPSYGFSDLWVVKTDSAGTVLSDNAYGGTATDILWDMVVTSDARIFLNGASDSPVSGNKTAPFFGGAEDIWMVEIDNNLSLIAQGSYGGSSGEIMYDVQEFNDGLVLVGFSTSTISGNKMSPLLGTSDAWMLTLDTDLNIVTDETFGGSFCIFERIVPISNGRYIVTGTADAATNQWKTRPGLGGSADVWVLGFDPAMNYSWNYVFGGDSFDGESDLIELANNHFTVFVESVSSGFSGDLTVANYGATDIWQAELTTTVGLSENAADYGVYPNPFEHIVHVEGIKGNEMYRIYTMQGILVQQGEVTQQQIVIDEEIAKGAYWLHISGELAADPIMIVKN